jgi:predicted outer membrane repeat protein
MTTKLKAQNNIFIRSGDKGISIGEWSDANLSNNIFAQNHIAIEIKDNSILTANYIYILDANYKAINLYHKNKKYNKGGAIYADTIYIAGLNTISQDRLSTREIKNIYNQIPIDIKNRFYQTLKEANITND